MLKQELDLAETKRKVVAFIKEKVEEAKSDGVVVGISGGIDSAVTAYLSVEALGSRRVMGMIMPDLRVTPESDISDSKMIAEELCVETRTIDIAPIHSAFMKRLQPSRLAEGNLRARIRMSLLYFHANSMDRLVVGTGDRSELFLGYFTKYGDGGVDILPLADLYKTEVRRLGEVLGIKRRIITKRSSPRLWEGQTAEGELGLSYESIDSVFRLYFDEKVAARAVASRLGIQTSAVQSLVSRYHEMSHKREMPPICKIR